MSESSLARRAYASDIGMQPKLEQGVCSAAGVLSYLNIIEQLPGPLPELLVPQRSARQPGRSVAAAISLPPHLDTQASPFEVKRPLGTSGSLGITGSANQPAANHDTQVSCLDEMRKRRSWLRHRLRCTGWARATGGLQRSACRRPRPPWTGCYPTQRRSCGTITACRRAPHPTRQAG